MTRRTIPPDTLKGSPMDTLPHYADAACDTVGHAPSPVDVLRAEGVRCTPYALAVAEGRQSLSGADLKGKASRYGGSYHATRCEVVKAMEGAGRCVVRLTSGRVELRDSVPDGATIGKPCAVSATVWNLPRA